MRAATALVLLSALLASSGARADFIPSDKECVGARQTEDPLSPPCISFWDGDNGGHTGQGVEGDEIVVVLYNDFGVSGDMTTPWRPEDETETIDPYYAHLVRTIKALRRSFQARFQTYDRMVRLIAYPSSSGLATRPAQRMADADIIQFEYAPFAVVHVGGNAQAAFDRLADHGVMSFGTLSDVPRSIFTDNEPYVWSFLPDQETQTALSASFICRSLQNRPAGFTLDPTLAGRTRTFALLYPTNSQRGPYLTQMGILLQQQVEDSCGMTFDRVIPYSGSGQFPTLVASLKEDQITTVVCYCIPQINELHVPEIQSIAQALGYSPEWYWDPASGMDRAMWVRMHGSRTQANFGITSFWHWPGALDAQFHYRAYLAQEPGTEPNRRWNFEIYHSLHHLFTAIQLAGPSLTPTDVAAGMTTHRLRRPDDPTLPGGGHDAESPIPFTFIDSAMAWWSDPSGREEEHDVALGCLRSAYGGLRSSAGDWPTGDAALFAPADTCNTGPMAYLEP